MNVANLELCKELYELSGWDDMPGKTSFEWYKPLDEIQDWVLKPKQHFSSHQARELHDEACLCPAYDLGYLLRKLAVKDGWTHGRFDLSNCLMPHESANEYYWSATYNSFDNGFPVGEAETPEDAACKLAIELFKQGILTPTGGKE